MTRKNISSSCCGWLSNLALFLPLNCWCTGLVGLSHTLESNFLLLGPRQISSLNEIPLCPVCCLLGLLFLVLFLVYFKYISFLFCSLSFILPFGYIYPSGRRDLKFLMETTEAKDCLWHFHVCLAHRGIRMPAAGMFVGEIVIKNKS